MGGTRRKGLFLVNTAREPRAYELMAIIVPELADEDLTNQVQKISSHITSATGAIKETLTDSPWGRRRLAYSVRHNSQDYRDGYYILFHFDLQPSRTTEIERELKLDINVMRYLLVHDDPKAGEQNNGQGDGVDRAAATVPHDAAPASTRVEEPVAEVAAAVVDRPATEASALAAAEPVAEQAAPFLAEPAEETAAAEGEELADDQAPTVAESLETEDVVPAPEESAGGEEPAVAENVPETADDAINPAGEQVANDGTDDTNHGQQEG